jgi:hypothetical protein
MATPSTLGEFQHSDLMTMPLDLDVSLAPDPEPQRSTARDSVHREAAANDPEPTITTVNIPVEPTDNPDGGNSNFVDFDLSAPINPGKPRPPKGR